MTCRCHVGFSNHASCDGLIATDVEPSVGVDVDDPRLRRPRPSRAGRPPHGTPPRALRCSWEAQRRTSRQPGQEPDHCQVGRRYHKVAFSGHRIEVTMVIERERYLDDTSGG
jgi:hypothetical protein